MEIKTFGDVDERSLQQLQRCMEAGDAEFGVLCADHHPGYSQPIGGGIAYEAYVSPSGVGFDIGCLAQGTRVTLDNGFTVPIEHFDGSLAPRCWDGRSVRAVNDATSLAARGTRETVRLALANDRVLEATGDHLVRTKLGWREVSLLRPGDRIACSPFIGLRREQASGELAIGDIREPTGARKLRSRKAELAARGLWPLRLEDPRLPALLRLLGFVSGDGHLTRDGKSATFYSFCDEDAVAVVRDVRVLGFEPRLHVRRKAPHLEPEIAVSVHSVALVALLSSMGSPVGKKSWTDSPMPWLFDVPAWLSSQFVSGFASADLSGPSMVDGRLVNIALKQVGSNSNAASFFARLLATLGFRTGISRRPSANGRTEYALQLLGGEPEQLRFLEEIGYCYSSARRVAAAATSSVAWQRRMVVEERRQALATARELKARGLGFRAVAELVAEEFGVTTSFARHSMYSGRGAPRSPKGIRFEPDHSGEIAWVAVRSVKPGDVVDVFDIVTSDLAASFLAEGLVVHNCGNKAARTELTRPALDALGGVERIMGEITRRISFGMGVDARERVDHPVLEKIRNADFPPQRKLAQLAESQLGTVGSGNHYVNLMEDEEGRIWVGVHFGSRGFGHKTASGFLALAQGLGFGDRAHEGEMDSPPVLFEIDSELGRSYISAMELAGEYAYAGRDTVVSKVLETLGAKATYEVHNHHNFAFREEHFGRTFWVIRKGCTPARPGQEGFVGATMGDDSVILEGVEGPGAAESLYSTVHGAGRVMSRTQAAGRVRRRKKWACRDRECARVFDDRRQCPEHPDAGVRRVWVEEQLKRGVVDWPAVQTRLRAQGIVLVGGGADEAPEVYKRLPDVLAAHAGSIRVKHTLRPLGVAMAGRDVHDPYRD
jgi:tRNA-splicing ligase RtcB